MANSTWNPSDLLNVTLSGSNLTATLSGTANGGVRTILGVSSGKYYFECTLTNWGGSEFTATIGVGTASATLANGGTPALVFENGSIYVNGTNTGNTLGFMANGAVVGIALDVGAQLIWFRLAPSGSWNGFGPSDPATGTSGISISSISTGPLYPIFGHGGSSTPSASVTANFGDSAFSGAVPTGFSAGFPGVTAAAAQARVMVMA